MAERAPIHVYADWQGLSGPTPVEQVHRSVVRGEEVLAFDYARQWLAGMLLPSKQVSRAVRSSACVRRFDEVG